MGICLVKIHHYLMVEKGNIYLARSILSVIVFATVVPVIRAKLGDNAKRFKIILSVPLLLILAFFIILTTINSLSPSDEKLLMNEMENGYFPKSVERLLAKNKFSKQTIQRALGIAIKNGNTEYFPIFIKNGADVYDWMNALECAVYMGADNSFLALLKYHPDLTIVNGEGLNILHIVITRRKSELVTALIEAGMDINGATKEGWKFSDC